jgi:hypothetical protein
LDNRPLFEHSCGIEVGFLSANFEILPQGIPPTVGGDGAHPRDDLEETPLTVVQAPNHFYRQGLPLTQAGHALSGDPVLG